SGDNGSGDNGSGDTGSGDNGSGDNGSGDTGSGDTGSGEEPNPTITTEVFSGGIDKNNGGDGDGIDDNLIASDDAVFNEFTGLMTFTSNGVGKLVIDTQKSDVSYTSQNGYIDYIKITDQNRNTTEFTFNTVTGEVTRLTTVFDNSSKEDLLAPISIQTPAPNPASPIILDLDGDGVETVGLMANIHFDHNGDGFKELTGFVAADDGLLVRDLNGDGVINSGKELFGDQTLLASGLKASNGFEALAELDSNGDGVIDVNDESFGELRIFQDLDQDGETDEGELLSLTEAGVESLSISYTNQTFIDEFGNEHRQVGSYTNNAGIKITMTDVWFNQNPAESEYSTIETSYTIASLPDALGSGKARSLHQAMAQDETGELQSLVTQFVTASSRAEREPLLEKIIFAWTGQTGEQRPYYPSHIDARKIGALETFYGFDLPRPGGTGHNYGLAYEEVFRNWSDTVFYQLAAQSHLKPFFKEIDWSKNAVTGVWEGDFNRVVNNLFDYVEANHATNLSTVNTLLDFVQATRGVNPYNKVSIEQLHDAVEQFIRTEDISGYSPETLGIVYDLTSGRAIPTEGNDKIQGNENNNYLFGLGGDDWIFAGAGNDFLGGGLGNDELNAGSGNDILDGGSGNDRLEGGLGSDTYIWGYGSGNDQIWNFGYSLSEDNSDIDKLVFKQGVTASDLTWVRDGDDLKITLNSSGETLRIKFHFNEEYIDYKLKVVELADGTVLDLDSIEKEIHTITGTEGNEWLHGGEFSEFLFGLGGGDNLYAKEGDDVLDGGAGSDRLYGGEGDDLLDGGTGSDYLQGDEGNDSYFWGIGSGNDTINDYSSADQSNSRHIDKLIFKAGITANDLIWTRGIDDLLVTIKSTGETLSIKNHVTYDGYQIESVELADGTVLDLASIEKGLNTPKGTEGADYLHGHRNDDVLKGLGGDDHLIGYGGDDILDGGAGDDELEGRGGSDTYLWGAGSGNDTITNFSIDSHSSTDDFDKLLFTEGISHNDLTWSRDGDDLKVMLNSSGETLRVVFYFARGAWELDAFVLADGTILDRAAIEEAAVENINLVKGTGDDDSIYTTESDEVILGLHGNDRLYGRAGDDILDGGAGNDRLKGQIGNDKLDGGVGNDDLYGGAGNDIYYWGLGSGNDRIYNHDKWSPGDASDIDKLVFKAGISASDLVWSQDGNDLRVTLVSSGETLSIKNHFDPEFSDSKIKVVELADGTVLDLASIEGSVTDASNVVMGTEAGESIYTSDPDEVLLGLDGNDRLYGRAGDDRLHGGAGDDRLKGQIGNDILDGGAGNDALYGGAGNDIYYWGLGSGNDLIYNHDKWSPGDANDIDKLVFKAGISASDLTWARDGVDLKATLITSRETLSIKNYFDIEYSDSKLKVVELSDGTELDLSAIDGSIPEGINVVLGTQSNESLYSSELGEIQLGLDGNDSLYGRAGDDTLQGGAGDDILKGQVGNDILDGGAGDDILDGGAGNDTYYWGVGSGNDQIYNVDPWGALPFDKGDHDSWSQRNANDVDKLVFKKGVSAGGLVWSRDGDDLKVTLSSSGETLSIKHHFDYYTDDNLKLKVAELSDGSVLDLAIISDSIAEGGNIVIGTQGDESLYTSDLDETLLGLDGNDRLYGRAGNDILHGGTGDDRLKGQTGDDKLDGGEGDDALYGGSGNDIYYWGEGSGNDSIYNHDKYNPGQDGDIDRLVFKAGISFEDLSWSRNDDDLQVQLKSTREILTIKNYYQSGYDKVDRAELANGAVINLDDVINNQLPHAQDKFNALNDSFELLVQSISGFSDNSDDSASDKTQYVGSYLEKMTSYVD
ncbi:hypothetical protein N483_17470, partial [Pseudoalteromonas luteoviolacea NCIMB 1944]